MKGDKKTHCIVFLNEKPMGITGSLKIANIFIAQHPEGNYHIYPSQGRAKRVFRKLIESQKEKSPDMANKAAAEFWTEFVKELERGQVV